MSIIFFAKWSGDPEVVVLQKNMLLESVEDMCFLGYAELFPRTSNVSDEGLPYILFCNLVHFV